MRRDDAFNAKIGSERRGQCRTPPRTVADLVQADVPSTGGSGQLQHDNSRAHGCWCTSLKILDDESCLCVSPLNVLIV